MTDLVPCHTSDQHPWFQEARSSRDNPKRDYYTWRDPGPNGEEPNNWLSQSGGTSWTLDEQTGQYYLHSFLKTQPDLNWDNPAVREEIKNVVRFWFDLGVDGMRVDAIWGISKDPDLADNSLNPGFEGTPDQMGYYIYDKSKFGPDFKNYLKELADVCKEFDDRQMIFEFYPDDKLGEYHAQYNTVATANPRVASTFFMELYRSPWHADMIGHELEMYINHAVEDALPVFCVGNHDQQRIASRLSHIRARAMSLLNLTLPGLSVVYYGDEIGMTNGDLSPDEVRDTFSPQAAFDNTRDLERTPMQWSDTQYAGFSDTKPWLPVHENRDVVNVITQMSKKNSVLALHRQLISLRKQMPVLRYGSYERFYAGTGYVLAFKREYEGARAYVLINFADQPQHIELPESVKLIATSQMRKPHDNSTVINGHEALLFVAQ